MIPGRMESFVAALRLPLGGLLTAEIGTDTLYK